MIESFNSHQKRIAIVVQRYGLEINGGAELHARLLADQLKVYYHIEVLTSSALDYQTWENHYKTGTTEINGITVIRFKTENQRNRKKANSKFRLLSYKKNYQKMLKSLKILNWAENKFPILKPTMQAFNKWIALQGPDVPQLIQYLENNKSRYEAIVFFTYLYYPTVFGLKVAPEKSILIPTAHDEPAIHLPCFKRIFNMPKCIIYNTESERLFVNRLFHNQQIDSAVAGVGISIPEKTDFIDFKERFNISSDYIVYIGRVENGKGCKSLISHFLKYLKKHLPLKLVLIGQIMMPLPNHSAIISLGFVSEDIKLNALRQALALVVPSPYESLSMVTLEAMKLGTPVMVNGDCEVLKQHVLQSHSGLIYHNYEEFEQCLNQLADQHLVQKMIANGKEYVDKNYAWERIIPLFREKIEGINSDSLVQG